MKKALWFSRHSPTPEQLAEIGQLGYELVAVDDGLALGARSINTDSDREKILDAIVVGSGVLKPAAIFGVWPVPLQRVLTKTAMLMVTGKVAQENVLTAYGSWNVSRTVEGQKPTFSHFRWEFVGYMPTEDLWEDWGSVTA